MEQEQNEPGARRQEMLGQELPVVSSTMFEALFKKLPFDVFVDRVCRLLEIFMVIKLVNLPVITCCFAKHNVSDVCLIFM